MYQAQKALAALYRLQLTFHPFLNVSLMRARHLKNRSQFGDRDFASCRWYWQTPFFNDLLNPAFLTPHNPISSNHMRETTVLPIRCPRSDKPMWFIQEFEETGRRLTSRGNSEFEMKWWACFPALVFHLEECMHLQMKYDAECQRNKQRPASFLPGSLHARTDNTIIHTSHLAVPRRLRRPSWPHLPAMSWDFLCHGPAVHPAHLHACMLNYWENCQSHLTQLRYPNEFAV